MLTLNKRDHPRPKIILLECLTFGLERLYSAAQSLGVDLILFTKNRDFYQFELSKPSLASLTVEEFDTFDVEAILLKASRLKQLGGIVSPTDTWSLIGQDVAERLNLCSTSRHSLSMTRDKGAMRHALFRAGLSTSDSIRLSSLEEEELKKLERLQLPVILKDSAGTGSQNVWILQNRAEVQRLKSILAGVQLRGELIADPYFNGTLYSAECLTWEGQTRVLAFSSRLLSAEPWFREEALSTPMRLPEHLENDISRWIQRVHHCIGYDRGFTHTEFVLTEAGPEVIEINPRLAGALVGESLCLAFGVNVYKAFIEMAQGKEPELLKQELIVGTALGQKLLYPAGAGSFEGIIGEQRLSNHIGAPRLFPIAKVGATISHIEDQRGCVAILLAEGQNSEVALLNVCAAAAKLSVSINA